MLRNLTDSIVVFCGESSYAYELILHFSVTTVSGDAENGDVNLIVGSDFHVRDVDIS